MTFDPLLAGPTVVQMGHRTAGRPDGRIYKEAFSQQYDKSHSGSPQLQYSVLQYGIVVYYSTVQYSGVYSVLQYSTIVYVVYYSSV